MAADDVKRLVALPADKNPVLIGAARMIADLRQVLEEGDVVPICRVYDAMAPLLDQCDPNIAELAHPLKVSKAIFLNVYV